MKKTVHLGFYAKKNNDLFQYEWAANNEFYIIKDGDRHHSDPAEYKIIKVGYYTAEENTITTEEETVYLGFYAKKNNDLFQYEWAANNDFYIIMNGDKHHADPAEYEILCIGYYTKENTITTEEKSGVFDYSDFLFTLLFFEKIVQDPKYGLQDTAYDDLHDIVQGHIERFINSKYNTDDKSEYDCIIIYLNAEL